MSVVCWGWYGDTPGAPHVGVTQLVGQLLQFISFKPRNTLDLDDDIDTCLYIDQPVVVPEYVVMCWSRCSLDALVRAQIEVELGGVGDAHVHGRPRGDVPGLPALLLLVRAEQTGVVTLLDHDERDAGLVVRLQLDAGLADGRQLVLEHVGELSLGHSVTIHDDTVRLVSSGGLVEHHEVLPHHGGQVLDDVLPLLLDPHRGRVPAGVGVLGANHGRDARLPVVSDRGMGHVRPQEYDGLVENFWSNGGNQDGVDSTELDVDLQTQIRQGLGRGFVDILGLDTLSGHPQQRVSHPLDLGIDGGLAREDDHHQLEAGE